MTDDALQFETIFDPADDRLTGFRKKIFIDDLGIDPDVISNTNPHAWWVNNYNEDAYKYSDKKWFNVKFDSIEVALYNNKIISMCGSKIYSDNDGHRFLRINMFYYTLKQYRNKCNGIIYIDNGFNDRHIEYALNNNCQGLFFSIYAYSSKLKALVTNHTTRRISNVRSKLKHLDNIQHVGCYKFNDVDQEFFYYPLTIDFFDPNKL